MAPGATSQQCTVCYKQIGSASKSCKHCGITVKQKKSLEHQKLKFDHQWAAKLKKDGNICKIMNSVDLIVSFFFFNIWNYKKKKMTQKAY